MFPRDRDEMDLLSEPLLDLFFQGAETLVKVHALVSFQGIACVKNLQTPFGDEANQKQKVRSPVVEKNSNLQHDI